MDDPVSSKSYESGVQMLQQAADKMDESLDDIYKYIFGHIMTQMTATAGIKKHGQAAVDALLQEFCQLDSTNVFEPLDASTLTASQKRESLRAVNLIKEKRSGKLKGRTCADGRSQRSKYTKEETTSPTVSTDALMISLMIDAKERRDVATADVEGAYLHADMEDFVLLKLVGEAVDIMCQVNPKYENFVVIENGKKVLYLQLLKALYVLTFQTGKVVGLRLDCTDHEFSRQCVEDAMYANKHNQTSGQRWLERQRKQRRWRYDEVRRQCTMTTEGRRSVTAEGLVDGFPTRNRLQGSR